MKQNIHPQIPIEFHWLTMKQWQSVRIKTLDNIFFFKYNYDNTMIYISTIAIEK